MDPYQRSDATIKEPPNSFWGRIRYLGPSLILTANIVGSGELIVTTSLGARAGFVTLWVVIVSCMAKVAIQLEFGKHAILTGNTTLRSFNLLPGPKLRGVGWAVYSWFGIKLFQMIQYGGILGGVGIALNMAFPVWSVNLWVVFAGMLTIGITVLGRYDMFEKASITMVGAFSLFTLYCLLSLSGTDYALTTGEIMAGLSFDLPLGAVGFALAMFAITGVGSDEIISYPYWCIEKGYARYAGPKNHTPEWFGRAWGWTKVMYMDAILSMVIYTLTTMAFYLLGASVLHEKGLIPEGYEMLATLSSIYTETVGSGAMVVFLAGAIVTLFSTLFVACISATRMFTDGFHQLNWIRIDSFKDRKKWFQWLGVLIPVIWAASFLIINAPLFMIVVGALSLGLLLLIVAFAAIVFKYQNTESRLLTDWLYDVLFWISCLSILGVSVRSFWLLFEH